MEPIDRNQPCPCGSGKRYKRCHGSLNAQERAEAVRIDHVVRLGRMRGEARQKEIEKYFGKGRPPIAAELNGFKIVVVGNEIQWSPDWKTLPDFLMSHFKTAMGPDWGKEQLAKDRKKWSPLFEWYAQTCEHQKKLLTDGQPHQIAIIGAACGVMWLTYGLYLLRHNVEIQERLLHRLRSDQPDQIFGAVQEVLVASALIRAGFELALEDEGDGSKTHVEFVATSKATGKSFSVEIKVCDPGRLEGRQSGSRTVRQLSRALAKQADHPRLVWIDLNRAPLPGETAEQAGDILEGEAERIQSQVPNLKINGGKAPPAYIILSNWPFRYLLASAEYQRVSLITGIGIEKIEKNVPFGSLRELAEFRALHQDMFRLVREFTSMAIPSTLDGSLPSKAFRQFSQQILVGERYNVPMPDGTVKPGEILDATVNEQTKTAFAMVRLDDGPSVFCTIPLSDDDIALYRDSKDTFFGKYAPQNKVDHPVEFYEFLLECYKGTPRETLIEWLKGRFPLEKLADLPQTELLKTYAEVAAQGIAATLKGRNTQAP